ncbi:PucR family transcriptional regulator [Patulibacter defluvii]|uniref:PucR family transcriptional regulator n=1 Tax=Patulibacter defluvii TaxID=3095358 RepID=UPI002A7575A6|nr:helix-turn-helix domain-containing protein [Patulibacter sp. DM4]
MQTSARASLEIELAATDGVLAAPATAVIVPNPGREIIAGMVDVHPNHGVHMALNVHDRIPELGGFTDQRSLFAETEASCAANIEQIVQLLNAGRPATSLMVPEAAREYAIGLVHRRIPLAVLLRAYRVGQNFLWSSASRHLREVAPEDDVVLPTLEALAGFLFEYVDVICDELVDAYHQERDRWVRTAAAVRAETARELIDGAALDEQVASSRLGYSLRNHHVGLVLSSEGALGSGSAYRSLEKEATEAALALGCREPLLVPAGASVLWAWCGTIQPPTPDALSRLERFQPREGVRIAIGRPAFGIEGFRVTHSEAQHAARLWTQTSGATGRTISYRSVELVSLLASDADRARRFVTGELGPLAAREDGAARLRETLLSFLAHGGSHLLAAEALHLHKNTVYTRVRRAEQILGTQIAHRRVELQTALMLAVTLGDEVLSD